MGDVYRPVTAESKQTLNFAFVGFYNEKNVDIAVTIYGGQDNKIGGKTVTVSPVHTWMLDLYPLRAPGISLIIEILHLKYLMN